MKVNKVTAIIAYLLSALITYGVYSMSREGEEHLAILLFTSFMTTSTSLLGMMSISLSNNRKNVNIRVLSFVFAFIFIIEHIVISLIGVKLSTLIILTGILFIIYILFVYMISRTTI